MKELSARIAEALNGLESPDLEGRVGAVDELAACASEIVIRVARLYAEDEDARFLIFERLGKFGSLMVPPMESVYREAKNDSLKLESASALLYLGSAEGIPTLMDALSGPSADACIAATSLAAAGVTEAMGAIEDAILRCDLSDGLALECLVSSLRKLGHPIAKAVKERLSGVEPDWLRNSLLG